MVMIICNPYEKAELIEYLRYAKQKKLQEEHQPGRFNSTQYDVDRINYLIQVCEGKIINDDYLLNSSKTGK